MFKGSSSDPVTVCALGHISQQNTYPTFLGTFSPHVYILVYLPTTCTSRPKLTYVTDTKSLILRIQIPDGVQCAPSSAQVLGHPSPRQPQGGGASMLRQHPVLVRGGAGA